MKKRFLILSLLFLGGFTVADNGFPEFPMMLYWDIKVWTTDLAWWTLKVYDSSNVELASFNIITKGKYWSNNVEDNHLLLNQFNWNLIFKVKNSRESLLY